MNAAQEAMTVAISCGALGGIASFLHIAYGGFKKIPTEAPSIDSVVKSQRIYFFIFRVLFGAISAWILSFWFMESFESGALDKSRLAFISALIGFSTTMLVGASNKFEKNG